MPRLFGAGLVGRQTAALVLSNGLRPAGFLDNDPGRAGEIIEGLPVRRPDEEDLVSSTVVVCTGGHGSEIRDQLRRDGAGRILGLSELVFLLGLQVAPESGYLDDLWRNRFRYLGLAARVYDDRSREVPDGSPSASRQLRRLAAPRGVHRGPVVRLRGVPPAT